MTTELKRRRLVRIENRDGKEVLSIHRKLQSKILHDLDTNTTQRERVLTQAFLLVRACFPFASPIQVPEPEKWSTCKKYLPHVLRIRRLYQTSAVGITPSVKLAQLFSDGGINLWERGLTKEGLGLLKSAEEILNHLDCSEVSLRANIHVIISLLLQDSGLTHIAECMDRSETALQIRRDYHARTAPSAYTKNDEILLYNAWSDYGCVLLQYNNFHEAEPIFAQCYEKYKTWGEAPSIPYEYAKYFHHMAFCHMYRGDHASAVALGEQGLHWVREATGESGATNRWKFDLACIVLQSGDLKRALQLHREVLDARIKQHGKAGHLTLQSQYAVGAVEAYLGRLEESEYVDASSPPPLFPGSYLLTTRANPHILQPQLIIGPGLRCERSSTRRRRDKGPAPQRRSRARDSICHTYWARRGRTWRRRKSWPGWRGRRCRRRSRWSH